MEFIFSNPTRHKKLGLSSINDSKGKQNAAQSDSEMVVHSISRVKSKRQQVSAQELLLRVKGVTGDFQNHFKGATLGRWLQCTLESTVIPLKMLSYDSKLCANLEKKHVLSQFTYLYFNPSASILAENLSYRSTGVK